MSLQTKRKPADHLRSQRRQAPAQGGLGAFLPHPQQTPAMTVDLVNDGQKSYSPPCSCPNEFHPRRWTRSLPVSGAPGPIAQTTPPSDRRIPNWCQRPAPSPARTAAAPSGTESTSWRWSPAACHRSRERARPPRHAPGSGPAGRHRETTSRCPTAAQRARSVAPVGHSPEPA